ncbi:MAG: phosphopantetheine-binding protein [Roseburia sp.]|nr:phosphopantetheine-binding protein [Roseburia sp.]
MNVTNGIKEKLDEVIADVARINFGNTKLSEQISKPDCDLMDDLGFDSLLMVELIVEIEKKFDIEFQMTDLNIDLLKKYDNLYNYIVFYNG